MIEKILNEINRLKNELDGYSALEALDYIESYINTFPEESGCEIDFTTKNEDLEEAANEWNSKAYFSPCFMKLDKNGNPNGVGEIITTHADSFKAGAEWQKQKSMQDFLEKACKYLESLTVREFAGAQPERVMDDYDIQQFKNYIKKEV